MLLLKVRRLFSVWSMVVPISILLTVLKAEPEVLAASFLRVGRNGMNKLYSNTQGRRLLRFIQWHAQGKNARLLKVSRVLSVFGMATSFPTQQHYKAKRQSWVKIQRECPVQIVTTKESIEGAKQHKIQVKVKRHCFIQALFFTPAKNKKMLAVNGKRNQHPQLVWNQRHHSAVLCIV